MKILKDKTYEKLTNSINEQSQQIDKYARIIQLKDQQISDLKFEISNPPKYEVGKVYGKYEILSRSIVKPNIITSLIDCVFNGIKNYDFDKLLPYWSYKVKNSSIKRLHLAIKNEFLYTETELEKLLINETTDILTKKSKQVRKKIEKLENEKKVIKLKKPRNTFNEETNKLDIFEITNLLTKNETPSKPISQQISNCERLIAKYNTILAKPDISSGNKQFYTKKLNKVTDKLNELKIVNDLQLCTKFKNCTKSKKIKQNCSSGRFFSCYYKPIKNI